MITIIRTPKTTRTSEQYKIKNTLNAKTNRDTQHKEDNTSSHSNGKNTNKKVDVRVKVLRENT